MGPSCRLSRARFIAVRTSAASGTLAAVDIRVGGIAVIAALVTASVVTARSAALAITGGVLAGGLAHDYFTNKGKPEAGVKAKCLFVLTAVVLCVGRTAWDLAFDDSQSTPSVVLKLVGVSLLLVGAAVLVRDYRTGRDPFEIRRQQHV